MRRRSRGARAREERCEEQREEVSWVTHRMHSCSPRIATSFSHRSRVCTRPTAPPRSAVHYSAHRGEAPVDDRPVRPQDSEVGRSESAFQVLSQVLLIEDPPSAYFDVLLDSLPPRAQTFSGSIICSSSFPRKNAYFFHSVLLLEIRSILVRWVDLQLQVPSQRPTADQRSRCK